ncbi:MAG: rod-binding protein [Candidatus Puniceispirillum sp. TMED52]|nr:MAG: rod-binding protein [Candidatus Puniceispirillum sp. TMED52]
MELPSLSSEHIIQSEVFTKKADRNADLREVAEQFEAIFINQILKQSRETKLADDLFGSSANSTYEQLLDSETSENIASHVNLGIADALVRQFSRDGA